MAYRSRVRIGGCYAGNLPASGELPSLVKTWSLNNKHSNNTGFGTSVLYYAALCHVAAGTMDTKSLSFLVYPIEQRLVQPRAASVEMRMKISA